MVVVFTFGAGKKCPAGSLEINFRASRVARIVPGCG